MLRIHDLSQRKCKVGQPAASGSVTTQRIWLARLLWGVALWLGLTATEASALDIKEVRWGFDGRVVAESFNLVSLRVQNDSTSAFDGELVLRRSERFTEVDAPIREAVYLAAGTARWVQFSIHIGRPNFERFTVNWGSGKKERFELPQYPERKGRGATVIIEADGAFSQSSVAGRRFPEALFPARVTACDTLKRVILDHEPRWSEPQQKAFLDWIHRGGEVHVMQDNTGKFPRFTGGLIELTGVTPTDHVGMGAVQRHQMAVRELTSKVMRTEITHEPPTDEEIQSEQLEINTDPGPNLTQNEMFTEIELDTHESILQRLKSLTRAEHNWVMIHLLALGYLSLFPFCWYLGQDRKRNYLHVFGFLLGTVFFFSLAFLIIGKRGSSEVDEIDSLLLVRPLDNSQCDVTGWSNAFVVDGGDMVFVHDATQRVYSTGQTEEAVRGSITTGAEAAFTTDMPPFSTRTVIHRAVFKTPPPQVVVNDLFTQLTTHQFMQIEQARSTINKAVTSSYVVKKNLSTTQISRLNIDIQGLPQSSLVTNAMAISGRFIYRLQLQPGDDKRTMRFTLSEGSEQALVSFLRLDGNNYYGFGYAPSLDNDSEKADRPSMYNRMHEQSVSRALGLLNNRDAIEFELPADRVRLLIYTGLAPEFHFKTTDFDQQNGRCLYMIDLPIRGTDR